MSKRTMVALAVVALAMAAYIAFFERGTLSTGELDARRDRVVERFVRPRVTQVEVGEGDSRVMLERQRAEDLDAFELGHWVTTTPVRGDADQESVDTVLSAIEYLQSRRVLQGISAEDRTRFGLDEPRARVAFTVADERIAVVVGGDEPRGEGVYAMVDTDPSRAYVVGRDFLEALQHEPGFFRRKELFGDFRAVDASAVEVRNGELDARMERVDGRWVLRAPTPGLAKSSTVDELLGVAHDVRATRFLSDDPAAVAQHGLDRPQRELLVRRERTDLSDEDGARDESRRTPVRLRVGGECPEHPLERVAIGGDAGPVVCVLASDVVTLDVGEARLRETRLVAMRDDEVDRAELAEGASRFELVRGDEGWKIVRGAEEIAGDVDAVADWARRLRTQESTSVEAATPEGLRARGLDDPRATITIRRANGEATEIVRLGAEDPEGVWARRGDEPQIARYPREAAELLLAPAVRFRERILVRDADTNLEALSVTREDGIERLEKNGSAMQVVAPMAAAADPLVTRNVARGIAGLHAVRFVASEARPEHGLARPRATIEARFEGALPSAEAEDEHDHDHGEPAEEPAAEPRTITLRIGAPTEGGAFAQLASDPAVFVVDAHLAEDLLSPLVSRDLLAADAADLESLTIVRGAERIELRRAGDAWTAGQGPADPSRTTTLMDRLGALRASGVAHYGEPRRGEGLDAPIVVLEVTRRRGGEPASYRVEIGAAGAGGDDGWYWARRSDLPAVFRVNAAPARTFQEYLP